MPQKEYPQIQITQEHYNKLPEYSMAIPAYSTNRLEWRCNINGRWLIGKYEITEDGLPTCKLYEPNIIKEKDDQKEIPT